MVKWIHKSGDNHIFAIENGLPKDVQDMMELVLKTYLPMPSFIDSQSIDKDMRDSEVRFMQYNEANHYVRTWLIKLANEYGKYYTNHSEKGSLLPEPVQVTTYNKNNFYNWHIDGKAEDPRTMTLLAQLTESNEYEGGDFEIENIEFPPFTRNKGTLIIMSPHLKHRVTPVTSGVRNSMITWFRKRYRLQNSNPIF
jgi:PKHD-type hydroxylase